MPLGDARALQLTKAGERDGAAAAGCYRETMWVVAIVELRGTVDAEAAALASDRGTTAYEERLALAAGLPAIVARTADGGAARHLLERIQSRRHGVIAVDTSTLLGSDQMVAMRRFTLEADAVHLSDASGERLPYDEIGALLRANHWSRSETETEVKGKAFSMGRALLSGGLVVSKTVSRQERTVSHEDQQLLYVFRRSGARPWVLYERGTSYAGLGAQLQPSSVQNFLKVTALLRAHAPHAFYDERLLGSRAAARAARMTGGAGVGESSASGVDLLAHILAMWATRSVASAYR